MPLASLVMPQDRDTETGMSLVASILTSIQTATLAMEGRMGSMESKLGQIHAEVKRTNGRVTEIEYWRDGQQSEDEQAASYERGYAQKEGEYHERVNFVWKTIWTPAKRVIAGALLVVAGATGERIFRLGEGWLW
jgi:hypothetical protein